MVNLFIKADVDAVKAEAMNGALLLFNQLTPRITMYLPEDYVDGNFVVEEQKVGFVLVDLILDSNTEISSNKIALKSASTVGVATIRIYPNIEPFKQWTSLVWTDTKTTGTITCELLKDFGVTSVDSNYTSGEAMGSKGLELEYVDFKFTFTKVSGNSPTLNTLELIFTGGS